MAEDQRIIKQIAESLHRKSRESMTEAEAEIADTLVENGRAEFVDGVFVASD